MKALIQRSLGQETSSASLRRPCSASPAICGQPRAVSAVDGRSIPGRQLPTALGRLAEQGRGPTGCPAIKDSWFEVLASAPVEGRQFAMRLNRYAGQGLTSAPHAGHRWMDDHHVKDPHARIRPRSV
jgi:hypothetical protein